MLENLGNVIDTDVLVIGGGAGGLWAGLSAKRHNPSLSVTVLDAHMVGRSGHAAFSNAWMAVVTPEDDLESWLRLWASLPPARRHSAERGDRLRAAAPVHVRAEVQRAAGGV